MKRLLISVVLLGLLGGAARADLSLNTSSPPGTPLGMSAGTTSGPMVVTVVSDNPPNDVMAAWQFQLEIVPEAGATGTLTFQDPATGPAANPSNYIFGSNGFGISVTNSGSELSANDFFFNPTVGTGAAVPGSPGANLLQMDFLASSNASGLFGVSAVEGSLNTVWADSGGNSQFFTNVPNGTDLVEIGEVLVTTAVPEPSSFWIVLSTLGLGGAALAGRNRRQHKEGNRSRGV
jgi:hypothetical protein